MMPSEFEQLIGFNVSYPYYASVIEPMYMAVNEITQQSFVAMLDKKQIKHDALIYHIETLLGCLSELLTDLNPRRVNPDNVESMVEGTFNTLYALTHALPKASITHQTVYVYDCDIPCLVDIKLENGYRIRILLGFGKFRVYNPNTECWATISDLSDALDDILKGVEINV